MPSFGIVKRPQQRHLEKYKFRYMEKVFSLSDYKSMKASWLLGLLCILLLTSRRCPSGASCRGRDAAEKKKEEEEELTKVVDEGT